MLHERFDAEELSKVLIAREKWRPYPTVEEREAWESILETVRAAHIRRGEEALGAEWPALPATLYLGFARTGNRSDYQTPLGKRRKMLFDLVLAECMEGEGRFLEAVANGIWLSCEESTWCLPAHVGCQQAGVDLPDTSEPIVDLFAGEAASLLAWTTYLLGARLDTVSPLIRPRVAREIDLRVLTPCLERDDFWWMGFGGRAVNNWNPWVNSNWLAAALLLETDADRRVKSVAKSLRSLDCFVEP